MAENRICRYGNKCNKGDECPFIHTEQGNISTSNPKPKPKCKFGEKCRKIPKCSFDHSPSTIESLTETIRKLTIVIEFTFSLFS